MNAIKSFKVWIVTLFLLALFSSGILAAGSLFSATKVIHNTPVRVYDATAAREAAIVYSQNAGMTRKQAYDATAAREAAILYANEVPHNRTLVYDATGAMLAAISPREAVAVASIGHVYDATAIREAAILYANEVPHNYAIVYDATGAMLAAVVFPVYP